MPALPCAAPAHTVPPPQERFAPTFWGVAAVPGEQRQLRGAVLAGRGPHALPRALETLRAKGPERGRRAHLQGGTLPSPKLAPARHCAGTGPGLTSSIRLRRPGRWLAAGGLPAASEVTRGSPRLLSTPSAPAGKPTSAVRWRARGSSSCCATTREIPLTRTRCSSCAPSGTAQIMATALPRGPKCWHPSHLLSALMPLMVWQRKLFWEMPHLHRWPWQTGGLGIPVLWLA